MPQNCSRPLSTLGLAAWIMLFCSPVMAETKPAKTQAETQLEQLKSEITRLQAQLESTYKLYSKEQYALKSSDIEIQANVLEMRELAATQADMERELSRLRTARIDYLKSLGQRREMLAAQIMAAYRLGRESRLKLVLNQDSLALLSRTLAYYDYFSRSQAGQIAELKAVLLTLDKMQVKIDAELAALLSIQNRQQDVLADMQGRRSHRLTIIANLAGRIDTHEARLAELQKNRQDLEKLLRNLSNLLLDIPPNLAQRNSPMDLKGKLPLPLQGRVKKAFGQHRSEGLRWQGWLISADSGADVKAIAYGRVIFSDWLRGYGLLMIIDHGDGFMSLYGNNESLLHEVGDWVEPGMAISTLNPASIDGLYFEIRRQGKALDPAAWLQR